MASFREVLELFVRADVQGAVTDLNRLGTEAERNLDKSTIASERLANRFLYTGAAMVGTSAVIGYGLLQLVDQFGQAERAGLLMDNTIQKMPELAGASRDAFDDLALSIMKKTAVDDDAILTAEALLGTFHLTAAEIERATPLVVDYARKFGVDLNAAAVQVGKAFEGNIATLQRNGIIIDENRYATDRFGAVIQALRENAGGFAEAEGQTFEGRLARVKNQLGNLGEAAGGGVVNALDKMLGAIEPVAEGLGDLNTASGGALGEVAAWGTVGLGAAGGLLVIAGGAVKAKNAVGDFGEAFPALAAKMGAATAAAGPWIITAGLIAGAAYGVKSAMDGSSESIDVNTEALSRLDDAQMKQAAEQILAVAGFDRYKEKVREVAQDNLATAQALVDATELPRAKREQLLEVIDREAEAQRRAGDARQASIDLLRSEVELTEEATDALMRRIDATEQSFSTELRAQRATEDLAAAQNDYNEKVRIAAEAGGQNELANAAVALSQEELTEKVLAAAAANEANTVKLAEAAGAADAADQGNKAFRDTLVYLAGTMAPGTPLRVHLEQMIGRLDEAGKNRHATITANGQQAVDEADRVAAAWENAADRIRGAMGSASNAVAAIGRTIGETYGGP